ncbi:uncharacterized protein LOC111346297 [Stylophora pistillata]|uniref:uncharacterized protein LOC111346297 n=1 Tax=Stylophora pistillata TaxID=50429 RepID=UPI000C03EBB1|nr:uncharacterized protein LOC111346297 [Stylophora pistillata]XP_022809324.1 uncharacterized protein LOC111346297 [Stylophora pistillata]
MTVSENDKRWLTVLVATEKIVAPLVREYVAKGIGKLYEFLNGHLRNISTPCSLRTLTYLICHPPHHADRYLKGLKFKNINDNAEKTKPNYNYSVNSPVDLAKLYLPDYLAKFREFDNSMDMSAALRLLGYDNYPTQVHVSSNPLLDIKSLADDVRNNVRNPGAHYDESIWTENFVNQSFAKLVDLVRALVLPADQEKDTLDHLHRWRTNGWELLVAKDVIDIRNEFNKYQDLLGTKLEEHDELLGYQLPETVKKLSSVADHLSRLEESLVCMDERVHSTNLRSDFIEGRQDELVERHNELVDRHDELEERHDELEERHDELEERHDKLEERQDELDKVVQAVVRNVKELQVNQDNGAFGKGDAQGGGTISPRLRACPMSADQLPLDAGHLNERDGNVEMCESSSGSGTGSETEDVGGNQTSSPSQERFHVRRINPDKVILKYQTGAPFKIEFNGRLPDEVEAGFAEFETLQEVELSREDDRTLAGRALPHSGGGGIFRVIVRSQNGLFLGETEILYLDLVEEVLKQAVHDPTIMKLFIRAAIPCLDENSGSDCDVANSTNAGCSGGKKSPLSVQLLQRFIYVAAKVDAQWFIRLIFDLPSGRVAFDSYKERSLLPEDVAHARGHKETAQYLKDVTKRLSENEEMEERPSNTIDWQEIIAAIEGTQLESPGFERQSCQGLQSQQTKPTMSPQPFTDKKLNYFKFASIVFNEFANALRQTFKSMWDSTFGYRPGYQPWDDSTAVRNLFLAEEGGKTKVPTHLSYEAWDCTALFHTTIYAQSFALLDSKGHKRTLSELYTRHRKIPHGKFHVSVVSPSGSQAETFTLAIDQLRLLRNSLYHSENSEIDKATFDQYMKLAKEAFKALGMKTDPIDVIGSLTESDFPTTAVRNLEHGMKQELRERIKFLESEGSSIDELKALTNGIKEKVEGGASKEDLALLEKKMDELKEQNNTTQKDSKALLPPSCLPPMVPHFTGRQRECKDIVGHVASTSIRIVSIWGSPGFGKTSVATAVGHKLQDKELSVYFFSLRGLNSKSDLISKLFSFFRRASGEDEIPQRLPIDEELFQALAKIPNEFLMILDNADDLLESGEPNVKDDFIQFLKDILSRSEKATFVITTRESLEFMNVHFEDHQEVRIGPLDESFSQALVSELLPNAISASDCGEIANICGHVPLAIKLLCSDISEDSTQPSQFLEDWKESVERNIVDLLDNPDYPSNLRLKFLFESSFLRLSVQERKAVVSLSILSGDFSISVAAVVMGVKTNLEARKILHRLQRRSLLDPGSKPDSFSMHKLLLSFVRERGEDEMKETMLDSKARFSAFYVSLFEKLNEQFLKGHSMSAFVAFYEEKQNIIQSLTESCSDPKTCDVVFTVLIKAEIFLDSLFWCEGNTFNELYESAINRAKKLGKGVLYKQLLISLAFGEMYWGPKGRTMKLLSKVWDEQMSCSSLSAEHKGKLICYRGICQVASGKTDDGIRSLEEALSLMSGDAEQRILRVTAFQVLAICYHFKKQYSVASQFYEEALQECGSFVDMSLVVIPPMENKENNIVEEEVQKRKPNTHMTYPLRLEIISVVGSATNHLFDKYTENSMSNAVIQIATELEKPILQRSLGLWKFQRNVRATLKSVLNYHKEATKLSAASISYHEMAITEYGNMALETHPKLNENLALRVHQEELQRSYFDHGVNLFKQQKYSEAQRFYKSALIMQIKLFGEEQPDTARSYQSLGVTQHKLGDFASAFQSIQRSLDIRVKLFGEEHRTTASSYELLAITQNELGDFNSAIQSIQRSLDIRVKLIGKEHEDTARSYELLGVTQHSLGDFASALQSKQCGLDIRVKLFGEEDPYTAESYQSLRATHNKLGDFA